jgi:phosphomannomutase
MSLIKSISGIRGTVGGTPGDNFTPLDVVKFTAAYGKWISSKENNTKKVVVGRDGRISGAMIKSLVVQTLNGMGIDVVDIDLSTTPTVEIAVRLENVAGGIIITASHNPAEWNALKLLNEKGEFINADDGRQILDFASNENFSFAAADKLGTYKSNNSYIQKHVALVKEYPLVDVEIIGKRNFTVVVDTINSTGAIVIPLLLKAIGVNNFILINEEINGKFAHNPEPLPGHLTALSKAVADHKADLGIAVDPDVDRLCFVCEDGSMFGEEYTLVAVADYVLSKRKGATVSNMSSTKTLKEITEKHGCKYYPSAVGEVNVVQQMKDVSAIIGGEGNGGIIVPDFHYGRDALIGIALFLSALSKYGGSIAAFRKTYPDYVMSKNKIELTEGINVKEILQHLAESYKSYPCNTKDGLKIEFPDGWLHLRSSNTEPIIRLYAEANDAATAKSLVDDLMSRI